MSTFFHVERTIASATQHRSMGVRATRSPISHIGWVHSAHCMRACCRRAGVCSLHNIGISGKCIRSCVCANGPILFIHMTDCWIVKQTRWTMIEHTFSNCLSSSVPREREWGNSIWCRSAQPIGCCICLLFSLFRHFFFVVTRIRHIDDQVHWCFPICHALRRLFRRPALPSN